MSGSASVEVSWTYNNESFQKMWRVADPGPHQILDPVPHAKLMNSGFELQGVLFTF
jgi:hypothetical protein